MRIKLDVAEEVSKTSVNGDRGGGNGGGVRGCRLQRDENMDAGDGTRHGREGTQIANPVCILVRTLRAGENMRVSLRNVDLPTLRGSVWCKRWHHGDR